MTHLDSIFKSRDIPLPTKVRLVKAMVVPVVMYGCERHFTDLVLKQYFTNDLLNLNVHHHKRYEKLGST